MKTITSDFVLGKTDGCEMIWNALAPYINNKGGDVSQGIVVALADMQLLADQHGLQWRQLIDEAYQLYKAP